MRDNLLKVVLTLVCFCVAVLSAVNIFLSTSTEADSISQTQVISEEIVSSESEVNLQANTQKVNTYILKKYKNSIGVFREGDDVPFRTIDTDMRALPELDRKLLTEGIKVTGETDLKYIIQDYES